MHTIRPATIKDIDAIITFRKQGNKEGEYINNRTYQQIINDIESKAYVYLIALKGMDVVGQIMLRKLTTRRVLFIAHMGILNSEKGSGLATELMNRAKSEMMKLKCICLELVVSSKNKRAKAFYEKSGFKLKAMTGKDNLTYTYSNIAIENMCLFSTW